MVTASRPTSDGTPWAHWRTGWGGARRSPHVFLNAMNPCPRDRGKVLVQMALVLAGAGESCADIEHLRSPEELFGSVPSVPADSTVFRTRPAFDAPKRRELLSALVEVRAKILKKLDQRRRDPVTLGFDASLVDVHSELTEQAAANYKGGFGFHPLIVFADRTGETALRAGNATANKAGDHVELLDAALATSLASHPRTPRG
ncbi:MAG: hypothetical protein HIU84_10955 [Acidobacteria bacterium]|nr:hypothetical protein [Acidobacteriota bacterium]